MKENKLATNPLPTNEACPTERPLYEKPSLVYEVPSLVRNALTGVAATAAYTMDVTAEPRQVSEG